LASKLHKQFAFVWSDLYKELYYSYGIGLKMRGEPPYIKYVQEDEWEKVIQSFSAICESNNISPSEIMKSAKMI